MNLDNGLTTVQQILIEKIFTLFKHYDCEINIIDNSNFYVINILSKEQLKIDFTFCFKKYKNTMDISIGIIKELQEYYEPLIFEDIEEILLIVRSRLNYRIEIIEYYFFNKVFSKTTKVFNDENKLIKDFSDFKTYLKVFFHYSKKEYTVYPWNIKIDGIGNVP
ncbi:hypothetical protein B0I10_1209 [Flavobacterium lacus]|uniref:Uncharacterized protein n=2 Tax=Flavobacterium lacus TaxID=1353778 RepID=A0A328WJL4_9FLAO|nr:hypothetical protein B0I10_1209 [Flavobacterium lacus]